MMFRQLNPSQWVVNYMIIIAGLVCIVTSGYYTIVENGIHIHNSFINYDHTFTWYVIRKYETWDYTAHQAVYNIGALIGEMMFLFVAKVAIQGNKTAILFTDWYFELQLTDLCFLIAETITGSDNGKEYCFFISFVLFVFTSWLRMRKDAKKETEHRIIRFNDKKRRR